MKTMLIYFVWGIGVFLGLSYLIFCLRTYSRVIVKWLPFLNKSGWSIVKSKANIGKLAKSKQGKLWLGWSSNLMIVNTIYVLAIFGWMILLVTVQNIK